MNKMRKLLCICLAALTVAAGAAFAVAAATTSATQFADNKDVIAYQKSIKELEAKQKDLKDKLKNVQNNRYTAQQKSAYYNELILSTEKKIETAQNLLDAPSPSVPINAVRSPSGMTPMRSASRMPSGASASAAAAVTV